jgi:hypothetical protein
MREFFRKNAARVAVGGAGALASMGVFAQGTDSGAIDPSSIVAALTANNSAITTVGLAVLAVIALIYGVKFVRRAM